MVTLKEDKILNNWARMLEQRHAEEEGFLRALHAKASSRTVRWIMSAFLGVVLSSCASVGHNESHLLQYKKDLREFYDVEKQPAQHRDVLLAERQVYLPKIYRTNVPLSLTDHYDTRTKTPIRAGDPLNIIINRVHIKDNKERIPGFNADVAVVVTVDDGRVEEPKHVLVAYEQDIGKGVSLPISDLVAYSTEAYGNEPVRIEITVFSMYNVRNKTYTQILGTAAGIGAAIAPAYAPAISVASQIGKILINSKQNAVIAKFTFQLYPWKAGFVPVSKHLGVPRVAYGHYFIANVAKPEELPDDESIHLDWNFRAYRVGAPKTDPTGIGKSLADTLKLWPIPRDEEAAAAPLDVTYIVLTVDDTKVSNARQIIARADAANRTLGELAKDVAITPGRVQFVEGQLNDLRSAVKLAAVESEFRRHKRNPEALDGMFQAYEKGGLSDTDKSAVLDLIRTQLPPMDKDFLATVKADEPQIQTLKKWYSQNRTKLVYDAHQGRYCIQKCD